MPITRRAASVLLLLVFSVGLAHAEPPTPPDPRVGLWAVPKESRAIRKGNTVALPATDAFFFDGKHVTLRLFTEKEWMWRTPDDIYRLETETRGNELWYRPPFGAFTRLAAFKEGHFETVGEVETWRYAKFPETISRIPDDHPGRALMGPRPVHDYRIKPTDPPPAKKAP